MILVTGATGHLGRSVIDQLLKIGPAGGVAALARDEGRAADLRDRGVDVRIGEYDDRSSLERAMHGVERVLLIAGTDEERRVQQHQQVVDAARAAGVQGVAYTGRTLKDPSTMANVLMDGHFRTEELVRASGLPFTIFRNVLYMDTLPRFVGERVFETGTIALPAGEGRVAFALRREMGEAMANALAADVWPRELYHLTGGVAASFDDVAAELTRLSGRQVTYRPTEAGAFAAQMVERGVPEVVARRTVGFMTDIANGQEDEVSPDLAQLLGRAPATLHTGLKELFGM
ncbi:NAD(P)H dehydrogenase (quinone) [Deinococcus metalli]|uniref:NAD(P)-dependent oxidoreductase n=1 Tax=Deinococcus metalli TaxID=1141878 RepID=A0A7W8KCY0_9DEIO|nr:SDR family oxidoreductase [Deinococcus metalli]MBB5375897.1 NAD(P)H dehydrogenase (quinone) [Deinococcus metalli]GHF36227.1 NAD(P)-dependent oxidoreductase [Deinococcus metalli]